MGHPQQHANALCIQPSVSSLGTHTQAPSPGVRNQSSRAYLIHCALRSKHANAWLVGASSELRSSERWFPAVGTSCLHVSSEGRTCHATSPRGQVAGGSPVGARVACEFGAWSTER